MNWQMEEVEAVLERIWYLHDKVSDAIHVISRAYFVHSIKNGRMTSPEGKRGPRNFNAPEAGGGGVEGRNGFVFMKEFEADAVAVAEARSLNAIRNALENLEDQLEFFHNVHSQQRSERDAAVARLEQSRIILAMRLADHPGKQYRVIEEALAFVGDVHGAGRFVSPENLYEATSRQSGDNMEDQEVKRSNVLMQMFISSLQLAKKSLKFEKFNCALRNAAIFAISMLALMQLHQVGMKSETSREHQRTFNQRRNEGNVSHQENSSQSVQLKYFDVYSARG